MTRLVKLLLVGLVTAVTLSGCGFDIYKLPLPGGVDVGSHPITVTAEFQDVLDLVPKSTVKVDDVSVGEVTGIKLDGYHAVVTMKLRDDTKLPDNPIATIRQTSLLGEKFVSLAAPTTGSEGSLADGDTIPLDHTGRNPEVEEVLGALSLVLNGGGIAQLKTIAQEVNTTLTGREDSARSLLDQINTLTTTLDDHKQDIVNAIDSLNRLSLSVRQQEGNIDEALDQLPAALKSIDGQRKDLVTMLQALDQLSNVGVQVINASKDATIDSVNQLQPVLTELANSGGSFVKAFNVFLTYPFVDEVVGRDPQVARNLHMGDYTNLDIDLELDLTKALDLNTLPTDLPNAVVDAVTACLNDLAQGGSLTDPVCTSLVGTQVLQQYCTTHQSESICSLVAIIPGLPNLPGLGGGTTGGNGQGATGQSGNGTGAGPIDLGGLLGSLGLGRAPTGSWSGNSAGGPTLGQMESLFDPGLTSVLVPPLVTRTPAEDQTKDGAAQ